MKAIGRVFIEYGFLSWIFGEFVSPSINSIIIDSDGIVNSLNLDLIYSDIGFNISNMDIVVTKGSNEYSNVKPEKTPNGLYELSMVKYFPLNYNVKLEPSTLNFILVNQSNECIFGLVKIRSTNILHKSKSVYMYTYDDEYFTDRDCYEIIKKIVTTRFE